jgi:hypothetical protein
MNPGCYPELGGQKATRAPKICNIEHPREATPELETRDELCIFSDRVFMRLTVVMASRQRMHYRPGIGRRDRIKVQATTAGTVRLSTRPIATFTKESADSL